jgi:hypothetical protein
MVSAFASFLRCSTSGIAALRACPPQPGEIQTAVAWAMVLRRRIEEGVSYDQLR